MAAARGGAGRDDPGRPLWLTAPRPTGPPEPVLPWTPPAPPPADGPKGLVLADLLPERPPGSWVPSVPWPSPAPRDDRPPVWLQVLAAVAVLTLAVVAISGWYLNDQAVEAANQRTDDVADRLMEATVRLATVEARAAALEQGQLGVTDTAETVSIATPSVFRVSTPFGDGSAWVAKSAGGRSQLVTNYHVLHDTYEAGGRNVQVVQDSRAFEGTVVAVAVAEDLALVEVAADLPVLPLAATGARVGDAVLVFGSPLGFDRTVTAGVISAFRDDLIQFDANISPGSSGGPVVDRFGDVIGVTVQKIVEEGAEGIGFAIPVATLCVTILDC